jgi:tetratricopeptide (TPR) repeat protein
LSGEHINIRAALFEANRREWDELTWQFCEALWGFFRHDRRYDDWIAMYRVGIPAARRCGRRLAEARLRGRLGYAYAKLRRFDDAITETNAELAIVTAEGDRQGTASAFSQLGRVARGQGDLAGALRYYEQARDLQAELGNRRGVALSRRRIGQVLTVLGRFEDAIGELAAAADTMAALGDRTQHARTLMFLGAAYAKSADPRRAAAPLDEALMLMRELGSAYYQGEILCVLGDVAERSGALGAARTYFRQAREHYLAAGDAKADELRDRIDRLAGAQDEPPSGV